MKYLSVIVVLVLLICGCAAKRGPYSIIRSSLAGSYEFVSAEIYIRGRKGEIPMKGKLQLFDNGTFKGDYGLLLVEENPPRAHVEGYYRVEGDRLLFQGFISGPGEWQSSKFKIVKESGVAYLYIVLYEPEDDLHEESTTKMRLRKIN